MLKLREEHMAAFRDLARRESINRTVSVLREKVPDFLAGLSASEAVARVDECYAKAESYGLTTEHQIRDFIAVQAVAGSAFDREPRFADAISALRDEARPVNGRLSRMRRLVADVLNGEDIP